MSGFKLKVILRKASSLDKINLIEKVIKKRFFANYKLTVGVDILIKDVEFIQGESATLCIWDISNQNRFDFYRNKFYKGAVGAIFIFDLSQERSYKEIIKWFSEIKESLGFIPFALIGNNLESIKNDDREYRREKAREFARNNGGIYFETSPNNIKTVEEVFRKLTRKIIDLHFNN